MPETRILHVNNCPEGWREDDQFVYIGRAWPPKRLKESPFANPFPVKTYGRANCIARYEEVLRSGMIGTLEDSSELFENIKALHGKTLACWCHWPKEKCHGEVLARIAAQLNGVRLCNYCLSPATREMGIPDPDLPMIPLCDNENCKLRLWVELHGGMPDG